MDEDHDDVSLGLALDAYMTEYHHPAAAVMTEVVDDLTAHRGAGERKALARSLLLGGFRFGAVHPEDATPARRTVLLGAGRYSSRIVQERLVDHVAAATSCSCGPLPERDTETRAPCLLTSSAWPPATWSVGRRVLPVGGRPRPGPRSSRRPGSASWPS